MMARRMSNKKVKQMICTIRDKRDECKLPFGHFFDENGLAECYISGWGPDNHCEDCDTVIQGKISLTADQLRDLK